MIFIRSPHFTTISITFLLFLITIKDVHGFRPPFTSNAVTARFTLGKSAFAASTKAIAPEDKVVKKPRVAKPKHYLSVSKIPSEETVDTTNEIDAIGTLDSPITVVTGNKKIKSTVKAVLVKSDLQTEAAEKPDSSAIDSTLVLTVYGEPTPLSRHMVSRGHMYNPSAGLQKEFANACLSSLPTTPLSGPLEATLYFYFSRPKNHYGTGKNSDVLKPLTAGNWHHKRKDLDNLVKFVLDALNAKAYEDDSQIAAIRCAKFYTEGEPYTKVIIRKLTETDFENFVF